MRFFIFLLIFLFACNGATEQSFDKNAMITNLTEQVIVANYQVFIEKTKQLQASTNEFTKNPNTNGFIKLNTAWKEAMSQWKKCELFNFGVAKDKNYMFDINFNEIRPKLIENVLNDTIRIDETYLKTVGSAAKGLPAIAFLLRDDFASLSKSARKLAYLNGLANHLNSNANLLFEEWKSKEAQVFAQNKDNNSLNILANQLLALIENLAMKRMEVIVKQYAAYSTVKDLDKVLEDKDFIISNLEVIHEVFSGKQGLGFDAYLDFLNAKFANRSLSAVINEQLQKSKSAIQVIDNEEKAKIAQEEIKKLLILVKADMFSSLGITVSFTDADGD